MTLLITGSALFIAGFTHLLPKIGQIEIPLMIRFQSLVNKRPWIEIFQEIWFLGRTVFSVIFLAALITYDWTLGSSASLIFLALVGFEALLKRVVNRIRPFKSSLEVLMLQPAEPGDASFPSGDALRIWFLALVLPIAAGSPAFLGLALILIALLVSLGRVAMGVHHFTDTLSGAGLGILGAGAVGWVWHFFNLI